jgi:hypothetical protein
LGLIIPAGPDWAYCTHNFPATPDYDVPGVAATPGGSSADGTAVDLFGSALAHDVEYLRLGFVAPHPSGGKNDTLATILFDPAGGTSWQVLIPFLSIGGIGTPNSGGALVAGLHGATYDFPVWVPSGSTLGIRIRTATASPPTVYTTAFAFGGNRNPGSWWCGQRVTAIGIVEGDSEGTDFTAGLSSSFSSWTNFGSVLSADCGALQFAVCGIGGSFYDTAVFQYEFGVAGQRIGPPIIKQITGSEVGGSSVVGPLFKSLPSGTQFQARAMTSSASLLAASPQVAAYAVH